MYETFHISLHKVFFNSQSEHDSAVDRLNEMLNEVESGLSDAEQKNPMYDQNDYVDLEAVMKQMEKQKVFYHFAIILNSISCLVQYADGKIRLTNDNPENYSSFRKALRWSDLL